MPIPVPILTAVDSTVARWAHEHATGAGDAALNVVTQMGDTWFAVVAGLAVAADAWRRGSARLVLPFLFAVVAGAKLITTGLKHLFDRARPPFDPVAATLDPSFPSGHSSTAAALFAAIALVVGIGRSPRARGAIAGVCVGLAVAVAASRVLLDLHWLTDVVAGLALGWAWFAVCAAAAARFLVPCPVTSARCGPENPAGQGRSVTRMVVPMRVTEDAASAPVCRTPERGGRCPTRH